MEITKTQRGELQELRLQRRLDASWADHLGKAIEDAIRAGSHQIELNFAQVDYLSSPGLRLLLKYYKQLKAVHGRFAITQPSGGTCASLNVAGLTQMISPASTPAAPTSTQSEPTRVEKGGANLQVFDQTPGAQLQCSLIGQPEKFFNGGFPQADCVN